MCNLTTINMRAFVHDGRLDRIGLLEAQRLSARHGYRITRLRLELPDWDRVQQRDRLLGCSLTGWQDAMEALGWTTTQQDALLAELKMVARVAADAYADALGEPRSLLVTCEKPEGTISLVAGGVSPGIHYSHAPYYIRRVRVNAADPLVAVARRQGWAMNAEVGQGYDKTRYGQIDWADPELRTVVIDFPVQGAAITKYDVDAITQLETYRRFMTHYVEHNASITVTVRDEEWDAVEEWVWTHWDEYVAVSFLALDAHTYDLAPYEAITREAYEALVARTPAFDAALLERLEAGETDFDWDNVDACDVGGACPIR